MVRATGGKYEEGVTKATMKNPQHGLLQGGEDLGVNHQPCSMTEHHRLLCWFNALLMACKLVISPAQYN